LLGVVAGEGVAQVLPTHFLKGVAALVFAGMGLNLLWSKSES
jgi:putative Ca2+/H+ antiporter (TMEM165/GDT1 family)